MRMRYLLPFCVLLNWSVVCAAPNISNIVFPNTIGKYQKFEISFDLGTYNNPYDYDEIDCWAEFVSPSGKVSKVFGFYYEGYLKTDDGAATSNEILVPTAGDHWKFRFSPRETGHWTFSMTARDSSGTTTEPMTNHFTFEVTPTDEKGFISAANNRYLKYDSGDPYFPIGDSYPWWLVAPWRASSNGTEKGTNIAKHYMDGMAANGVTYNRFELNFYEGLSLTGRDFVLQKTFYSYYNQHDAWQLDEVMDYAKEKGVNINLALWAAADFVDPGSYYYVDPVTQAMVYIPDTNSQGIPVSGTGYGCFSLYNPYYFYEDARYRPTSPDKVGPCKSKYEFFSHPESISQQKKLFRYIVSRWGYCTNLMAFELIDEMASDPERYMNDLHPHYAPRPSNVPEIYSNWASTMYDYLKSVDPNQHLISVGLGNPADTILGDLINDKMDFVNIHWYFDYGPPNSTDWMQPGEYSFADAVYQLNLKHNKPVAIMEMGWTAAHVSFDSNYYEMHNLVWAGLFNGSMGLHSVWAHEVEVLGNNALNQYIGVSAYSKILPPLSALNAPHRSFENGLKWEYLMDNVHDQIYGWVQDTSFTFFRLWRGYQHNYLNTWASQDRPPISSNEHFGTFPVTRRGHYRINWYDTQTGAMYLSTEIASGKDGLKITMPVELRTSTWADAAFTATFISGEPSLFVHPNPSNGNFNVTIKHDSKSRWKYSVYSILGSKVMENEIEVVPENPTFSIDLEDFAAGIYLLTLASGKEQHSKLIVKL